MRALFIISALTLYLLGHVQALPDDTPLLVGSGSLEHHQINVRAPETTRVSPMSLIIDPDGRLSTVITGIFYKNGFQTYCEVAIVNENTGIIAASCLDYTNNKVATDVSYGVAVSTTSPSQPGQVFTVGTPIPHPSYNPQTYANNIAVLPLTASTTTTITNTIDDWPDGWVGYFLNHRSVNNDYLDQIIFQRAIATAGDQSSQDTQGCTAASAIFSDNQSDFVCNNATLTSYLDSSCQAPYGSVYGVTVEQDLFIGGLFSHSAIYGSQGYCGQGKLFNYYILLRNYLPWVQSVSTGTITTSHAAVSTNYTAATDVGYTMTDSRSNVAGVVAVGNYTTGAITSVVESESVLPSTTEVNTSIASIMSTEIVSSTDIVSSTETVSETATVSETSIIGTTDIVSQTSVELTTSTLFVTMTSVQVELTTVTSTQMYSSVIGETDSIISAVIVSVTDVSVVTVGNGQAITQTVTEQQTVTVPGNDGVSAAPVGETITVTETVSAATNTVYATNYVTESVPAVISTTTATFTDYAFTTVTEPGTSFSTITALSTAAALTTTTTTATVVPSNTESSSSSAESQNGISGIPIWLIVLFAIVSLAMLILLVWFILYRRRRQREKEQQEMLAYGAPMQLPQTGGRAVNWLNQRRWGRPGSEKEMPPDYRSMTG